MNLPEARGAVLLGSTLKEDGAAGLSTISDSCSGNRLRWGVNEMRRMEDIDAEIIRTHGESLDEINRDNEKERIKKSCRGGHGLRPYNAPKDSMMCEECQKPIGPKGSEFFGCK